MKRKRSVLIVYVNDINDCRNSCRKMQVEWLLDTLRVRIIGEPEEAQAPILYALENKVFSVSLLASYISSGKIGYQVLPHIMVYLNKCTDDCNSSVTYTV